MRQIISKHILKSVISIQITPKILLVENQNKVTINRLNLSHLNHKWIYWCFRLGQFLVELE